MAEKATFCMFNIMAAGALVMQVARASAAMGLTKLFQNIPGLAPQVLSTTIHV